MRALPIVIVALVKGIIKIIISAVPSIIKMVVKGIWAFISGLGAGLGVVLQNAFGGLFNGKFASSFGANISKGFSGSLSNSNVLLKAGATIVKGFVQAFDFIKYLFSQIGAAFSAMINNVGKNITVNLSGLYKKTTDSLTQVWHQILKALGDFWGWIKDGFSWIFDKAGSVWEGLTAALQAVWDGLSNLFSSLPKMLSDLVNGLGPFFTTLGTQLWDFITTLGTKFGEILKGAWDGLQNLGTLLQPLWDLFGNLGKQIWNGLKSVVDWKALVDAGGSLGQKIIDGVISGIQRLWDEIKSLGTKIGQAIKDALGSVVSGITGGGGGGGGGFIGQVVSTINPANWKFAQGGLVPSYLAAGGFPGSPRGTDTVPAWLTPNEFVVNRQATSRNLGLLNSINNGSNLEAKLDTLIGLLANQGDVVVKIDSYEIAKATRRNLESGFRLK
jgi:phage-related protein